MPFDLDRYRERAERFSGELSREYYLHMSGRKAELEIESIYRRFADLFDKDAVARLRDLAGGAPDGDPRRRLRYLLHFAIDGLIGIETRDESVELAGLEASLEVDPGDGPVPFRAIQIEQANEPDPERRARLEEARGAVLVQHLNPLHHAALERGHEICSGLGWPSYAAAYGELRGIDLEGLAGQAARFLEATRSAYPEVMDPELERAGVARLAELRRCDMPRFFRAAELDSMFEAERLIGSFRATMGSLGIDLDRQPNVHLDTEKRPTKSPRAFCSVPRVPDEIHLVISPHGGCDDYGALFHEGGHAEHYAHTDPALAFEFRMLGDNSVTESFAFLLEHLVSKPLWLRERLGVQDPQRAIDQARAAKLLMLRRYSAKLAYELELHGEPGALTEMPDRYATLLGDAVRIPWPAESWLADVDDGFYAACYLRAWALEARWWGALQEQFGEAWFDDPRAGDWLREVWREGQRLDADELLAERLGGEPLDLAALAGGI
ncbi:MAG: hypothetical protein ACRDK1_05520 [Solirubrobacterales bacterium]